MAVNPDYEGINVGQENQSNITDDDGVVHSYGDGQWVHYYPIKRNRKMYLHLFEVGYRKFRVAAGDIGTGGAFHADRFATQLYTCRLILELARQRGIDGVQIEFGSVPRFGGITPTEWKNWIDRVDDLADQFAALIAEYSAIHPKSVFMLGNEIENFNQQGREGFVSITRASNVVTMVTTAPHSLATGDPAKIWGNLVDNGGSVIGIPGNFTIASVTVVNSTTFTFPHVGTDQTSSTGYWSYHSTTARNQMKRKATSMKNRGYVPKKSYSCVQGQEGSTFTYWISNFLSLLTPGDLDHVDLNIYNGGFSNRQTGFQDFCTEVMEGITRAAPGVFRVTEWHNAPLNSGLDSDAKLVTYWLMQRKKFLQAKGVIHYLFCYVKAGDELAMKRPFSTDVGENFREWWWPLTNQRSPDVELSSTSTLSVVELRAQKLDYERFSAFVNWNYGQDTQGGTFNTTIISGDMIDYRNLGHNKVRTGGANFKSSGVTTQRQLVQAEVAAGLLVNYVGGAPDTSGGKLLTDDNFSEFEDFIIAEAGNAVAYGASRYTMFNEIERWETVNHTLTNCIDKMLATYDKIHALHPNLDIDIAMIQSQLEYIDGNGNPAPNGWILHKDEVLARTKLRLGYNVYADNNLEPDAAFEQFKKRVSDLYNVFGSRLYISEGVLGFGLQRPVSEVDQGIEIRRRVNWLLALGITEIFLFTYRWDTANTFNQMWPIRVGGAYKGWFPYLYDAEQLQREVGVASQRHALEAPRGSLF